MDIVDNNINKKQFIEELSLVFEERGKPRISGLIMGWLMICDPPEQSFADLVEHLQVSKASISNMTRMLLQAGLIEKTRIPGERQIHFRIKEGAWSDVLKSEMDLIYAMREISKKGLELIKDETGTDRSRLAEMHKFYEFAANRMPCLIEEYRAKHYDG